MGDRARERISSWLLFAAAFGFIVATLELAFEASSFLMSRGYLWTTIKTLFGVAFVSFAYLLIVGARIRTLRPYLHSLPAFAAFAYAVPELRDSPAERFHFIEYGALYLIALRAIAVDVRGLAAYPLAVLVTAAAGYADESMQGMSDYRYFDWDDVKMNAYAALFAAWICISLFGRDPGRARFDGLRAPGRLDQTHRSRLY